MVVRDCPGLEVLVLRRTPAAVFGPGATVFPGGAVDDADATLSDRVVALDDDTASAEHGVARGGLAFRIAAVRECFEESGILLARDAVTGERATPNAEWRDALNAGHATFRHMLEAENLVVDGRDLSLFAHWLTPVGAPRRYDTWFFVARAPAGHVAAHDDNEAVASTWIRPADALAGHRRNEIDLIFPTLRSLEALARFATTDDLAAALATASRGDDGRPRVVPEGSGERVVLPGDEHREATWTIPLPDLHVVDEARMLAERTR
jgi:8-oxo-dGTP pyrophosphatase MutT (NUDIX family)